MKRLKENHYKMVWDPFRYHINGDKKNNLLEYYNCCFKFFLKLDNITITIIVF